MPNQCSRQLIFFRLPPPTLPGERKCQGVLTQKSADKYTKHVRLFIQNIPIPWFPIAVLEEDKYVVKRLNEAPACNFRECCCVQGLQCSNFLALFGIAYGV